MKFGLQIAAALLVVGGVTFVVTTFTRPPVISIQRGYRGVAQEVNYLPAKVAALREANKVPAPEPKQDPAGQPSSRVYQNVKVLGGVDGNEFLRVMAAVTDWVSPKQSCTYCHSVDNLADDTLYTKIVARRMMQMTEHINKDWQSHVGIVGVTCYTCHRGMPVPANIWYNAAPPAPMEVGGLAEVNQGKNLVSKVAAYSSLPYDPLTPYLEGAEDIRVADHTALPGPGSHDNSIKHTDLTYALMLHVANSLGVNCTYCHNSRAFWDWDQSSPPKVTAWYGIRMVRDLNTQYLDKLKTVFPAKRLGALGDAPKINCATCHQGVYKPLYGASMVKDYPELGADGQVDLTADIGSVGDYKAK